MASQTFYGTAASVVTRTGIGPTDLGLESDEELTEFLEGLLGEMTDVVDRQLRKSYLADVPAGLNGIVSDIVADAVRVMVVSRQTPVVRIDDFAVRTLTTASLSPDILRRLRPYSAGSGVASYDIVQEDIAGIPTTFTLADLDAE